MIRIIKRIIQSLTETDLSLPALIDPTENLIYQLSRFSAPLLQRCCFTFALPRIRFLAFEFLFSPLTTCQVVKEVSDDSRRNCRTLKRIYYHVDYSCRLLTKIFFYFCLLVWDVPFLSAKIITWIMKLFFSAIVITF